MCFPLDFTLTLCAEIDSNLLAVSVCGKVFLVISYLYQNNQYNPNLSMYWWALCASHRDAVNAVLGSAVGNAFVNLVCPVQQWLADSDAVIPAQTSGVSAAQGVGLLACRWTPSEEGNAILQGVVVPAIGLKKGDVLVARTC